MAVGITPKESVLCSHGTDDSFGATLGQRVFLGSYPETRYFSLYDTHRFWHLRRNDRVTIKLLTISFTPLESYFRGMHSSLFLSKRLPPFVRFLLRDTLYTSEVYATIIPSVYPSVSLSVTVVICVKTV